MQKHEEVFVILVINIPIRKGPTWCPRAPVKTGGAEASPSRFLTQSWLPRGGTSLREVNVTLESGLFAYL